MLPSFTYMAPSPSFHVSPNRLQGSLNETSLGSLLDSCAEHLITGAISITTLFGDGYIELRAGAIEDANYRDRTGLEAVRAMKRLGDGTYELVQRLPDLSGQLGVAAEGEGDLADIDLVRLMRHCEDEALSCAIIVVREFDRAEINYRAGELVDITINGRSDDDAYSVINWKTGKFRIAAPPLPFDIDGWPMAVDPTVPFTIEQLRPPSPARAKSGGLPGLAPPPSPRRMTTGPDFALADDDGGRWQLLALGLVGLLMVAAWIAVMLYVQ